MPILFLLIHIVVFSQEKRVEKTTFSSKEIEIITDGLDDVIIENTTSNLIEVILLDENPNTHQIKIKEVNSVLNISFILNIIQSETPVFRKYITKRLHRAKAIIKIPSKKDVSVYGKVVGVESKNYKGNIAVYIDRGNIKLHNVKYNAQVKFFLGNVYAKISQNTTFNLKTTKGKITIDDKEYNHQLIKNESMNTTNKFEVETINANIILKTK